MSKVASILLLSLCALGPALAPTAVRAAEKQLCLVCHVKEGASEEEEVKAWRTHDGVRYGFCTEKCAKEFDADPAAYVPASLPRRAPELTASDLAGRPVTWKGLEGKVVLVDFWATWCAPCRKSMPELQALHDKYASRGFTVLGISIDEAKSASKVKKFAASKKIRYPIAIDSEKAPTWERFRVKAVPAAFLVDQEGRIVAQWTGASAEPREVEEKLGTLLARED
jgi:peroxiredoxin/YHS domain-containing protein